MKLGLVIDLELKKVRQRLSERGLALQLTDSAKEFLIKKGRIGCVPGVDFGPAGEDHVRFCFARDRAELSGALEQMRAILK